MIRLGLIAATVFVSLFGTTSTWAQAVSSDAVKAVQEETDRFALAYGAGTPSQRPGAYELANPNTLARNSLSELMEQFDDRATYAGTLQPFWLRGKAEIGDLWARYFARYSDRRMIFRQRDIQVHGNAAVETGYAEMYMGSSPTTSVVTFMRYSMTRVQRNGRWVIVSMIVDRLPSDQPPSGTMPPWSNSPAPQP
jgi:ketosteroid isomerase-like protein